MTAPRRIQLQKDVRLLLDQRIERFGDDSLHTGGRSLDDHACADLLVRPLRQTLLRAIALEVDGIRGIASREELDRRIAADLVLAPQLHLLVRVHLGNHEGITTSVMIATLCYTLEKSSAKASYSGASFLQWPHHYTSPPRLSPTGA